MLALLVVAWSFNGLFEWRQYPVYLQKKNTKFDQDTEVYAAIKHEDFVYALSEIDSFVDITEDELLRIYALATNNTDQ